MRILLTMGLLNGLLIMPIRACPVCASDTGAQVRAGLKQDLVRNIAAVVTPFAAGLAIVVGVHLLPGRTKP